MKAIVSTRYGTPDLLEFKDVEKPVPGDDEALVKIYATSLNAADLETLRGDFAVRIAAPFRPMHKILGTDVAGRIEAVGKDVEKFQSGDEIWGDLSFPNSAGTFAEYVCVPEKALRRKPASMTFEEAAAVPTSAVVALQNLRAAAPASFIPILSDTGQIQSGQKVLINGAGGGVGTFALQIAKSFGAEVTGVDSSEKADLMRSLGADHVIDFKQEDFTKSEKRYDLILDVVTSRSIFANRRSLSPEGIFVLVGGTFPVILQAFLLGPLLSMRGKRKSGIVPWQPNKEEDLVLLEEMIEAGKVAPVIDRIYPLSEVPEALRYLADGRALGKVVIRVDHDKR